MPKWKDMQFNRNHLTYLNNPAIVLIFTIAVSMNFGMSHAEPSKTCQYHILFIYLKTL